MADGWALMLLHMQLGYRPNEESAGCPFALGIANEEV